MIQKNTPNVGTTVNRKIFLSLALSVYATVAYGANENTSLPGFFRESEENRTAKELAQEKKNFDRRMRRVKEDAAVEAERARLEAERWQKVQADRQLTLVKQNPIPILLVPKWVDIVAKPEYSKLSDAQKAEAKAAYFDYYITPHVEGDGGGTRAAFMAHKANDEPSAWTRFQNDGAVLWIKRYWPHLAGVVVAIGGLVFRKRVAIAGGYVVSNAFRIAALTLSASALIYVVARWLI